MVVLNVLNPVAETQGGEAPNLSTRPTSLEGKRVGLVWNGSPNGDVALKRVGELIQRRLKSIRLEFYSGTVPLHKDLLQKAQRECDLFVGSTGD